TEFLAPWRGETQLEQKPVQLCFRQRKRAVRLDGVLGRQHAERPGQIPRDTRGGDRSLLHRLEQGTLRLGPGPVQLVREQQAGEGRPGLEDDRGQAWTCGSRPGSARPLRTATCPTVIPATSKATKGAARGSSDVIRAGHPGWDLTPLLTGIGKTPRMPPDGR